MLSCQAIGLLSMRKIVGYNYRRDKHEIKRDL